MIIDGDLSLLQQEKGRKKFLLFSFINGISFTLISGNLLTLYLLKLDCPPSLAAIIASFVFLGTAFSFVAKFLLSRYGVVKTMMLSWILRSVAVLFMAAVPLLLYFDMQYLTAILLTVFSFFLYAFRSVGIGSLQPLIGELTTEENQGSFSSSYFLFFSIATLVALSSVLVFLFFYDTIVSFQIVLVAGALCGFLCSYIIYGINETTLPSKSAEKVLIKQTISKIWKKKKYRTFLIARSLSLSGLIIIIPISILAIKNIYGVSNYTALIFALVQLLGGIIMTYLSSILSDITGPKPLIKIYILLLFVISFMWIFAPGTFIWWYCAIIFFIGGACFRGLSASVLHYFLMIIPKEDNVGFTLCFTAIGGLVAGFCGIVIAGGLIRLFVISGFDTSLIYRLYFIIMVFLLIPVFYLICKLSTISDWEVNKVLGLMFAPRDVHTLFILNKIKKYSSPRSEFQSLVKLEERGSYLSEKTLLYYLESPRFLVRIEALRGLKMIKFSDTTERAIMRELSFGEHSTGYLAAIILAERNNKEAIPLLRKYLDSEDLYLKGTSMIGLALLKDEESYGYIEQIFKNTVNPKVLINGAIALSKMKDVKMVEALLNKTYISVCPEKLIRDEIIYCTAELTGYGDEFYKILRIYEKSKKNGILTVIELLSSFKISDPEIVPPGEILLKHLNNELNNNDLICYLQSIAKHISCTETTSIVMDFLDKSDPSDICDAAFLYIFIVLFNNDKNQ